uniref:Dynein light chain Tctex-type protein 2B n=1 Tax=Halisarca dujardinii TaxID=2583056 RepID=A0A9F1U4N0_HALDU|nr:dynein light chain Tctex-type protein 2B [Halisarca dujardinii]
MATEVITPSNTYSIRPKFQNKFRPGLVKELLHGVLVEYFHEKQYAPEYVDQWTKELCDLLKSKLKECDFERYKFVVQVVIGEQRGEGVKMACRCFWDSDTDNYAQDIYMSDTLFCVAAAFGVFYY